MKKKISIFASIVMLLAILTTMNVFADTENYMTITSPVQADYSWQDEPTFTEPFLVIKNSKGTIKSGTTFTLTLSNASFAFGDFSDETLTTTNMQSIYNITGDGSAPDTSGTSSSAGFNASEQTLYFGSGFCPVDAGITESSEFKAFDISLNGRQSATVTFREDVMYEQMIVIPMRVEMSGTGDASVTVTPINSSVSQGDYSIITHMLSTKNRISSVSRVLIGTSWRDEPTFTEPFLRITNDSEVTIPAGTIFTLSLSNASFAFGDFSNELLTTANMQPIYNNTGDGAASNTSGTGVSAGFNAALQTLYFGKDFLSSNLGLDNRQAFNLRLLDSENAEVTLVEGLAQDEMINIPMRTELNALGDAEVTLTYQGFDNGTYIFAIVGKAGTSIIANNPKINFSDYCLINAIVISEITRNSIIANNGTIKLAAPAGFEWEDLDNARISLTGGFLNKQVTVGNFAYSQNVTTGADNKSEIYFNIDSPYSMSGGSGHIVLSDLKLVATSAAPKGDVNVTISSDCGVSTETFKVAKYVGSSGNQSTSSSGGGGGGGGSTSTGNVKSSDISIKDKDVTVNVSNGSTKISDEQMKTIIEGNKTKDVVIKGTNYSISFTKGTMQNVTGKTSYDFSLTYNNGVRYNAIKSLAGDNLVIQAHYNYEGELPGEATISMNIGKEFAGQTLEYHFYNPKTGKFEYIQDVTVDKDGYVTVKQTHCSDYVLIKKEEKSVQISEEENIPKPDVTTNEAFTDIINHWAKNDIMYVIDNGLFSGTEQGIFSPDSTMTRGMVVTVLGRYANIEISNSKSSRFTDVNSSAYYAPYIEWAAENGVVSGLGDEKFSPDTAITREQMAVILMNFANKAGIQLSEGTGDTSLFADDEKISSWSKESVYKIKNLGIIGGRSDGSFDPQGMTTRAEVASMLSKFINMIVK